MFGDHSPGDKEHDPTSPKCWSERTPVLSKPYTHQSLARKVREMRQRRRMRLIKIRLDQIEIDELAAKGYLDHHECDDVMGAI